MANRLRNFEWVQRLLANPEQNRTCRLVTTVASFVVCLIGFSLASLAYNGRISTEWGPLGLSCGVPASIVCSICFAYLMFSGLESRCRDGTRHETNCDQQNGEKTPLLNREQLQENAEPAAGLLKDLAKEIGKNEPNTAEKAEGQDLKEKPAMADGKERQEKPDSAEKSEVADQANKVSISVQQALNCPKQFSKPDSSSFSSSEFTNATDYLSSTAKSTDNYMAIDDPDATMVQPRTAESESKQRQQLTVREPKILISSPEGDVISSGDLLLESVDISCIVLPEAREDTSDVSG